MNVQNYVLPSIETTDPTNEPTVPAGTRPDGSRKSRRLFRPALVIGGVALCIGLASCVVPYDSQVAGPVSVTSYSPGYTVTSLPGGYRSEAIAGSTYYYHDGYYYRQGSGGYVVVDAPRTSRYYDEYSRRQRTYQPDREASARQNQRYDNGQVITRLPQGYRVVNHRGNTYYQAGDQYYRRQGETYVITTSPY